MVVLANFWVALKGYQKRIKDKITPTHYTSRRWFTLHFFTAKFLLLLLFLTFFLFAKEMIDEWKDRPLKSLINQISDDNINLFHPGELMEAILTYFFIGGRHKGRKEARKGERRTIKVGWKMRPYYLPWKVGLLPWLFDWSFLFSHYIALWFDHEVKSTISFLQPTDRPKPHLIQIKERQKNQP